MKKTALIFRYELLPASETFIKSQAEALVAFQPCYAGVQRAPNSLPVPEDSVLLMNDKSLRGRIERRTLVSAGGAPIFYRRLRDRAPVLMHAHFAPDAAIALPLASQLNIPLIVTLHGYAITSSEEHVKRGHGRFYLKRKRYLFESASLFICVSEFIRQRAIMAGFPASKLRVHYIGVDRTLFNHDRSVRDRDLVLFVGRLVEKKGCAYLIQAMALVQQKCKAARLVIIGDGPLRSRLETLARDKGVTCQFLGSQPSDIVREWLSRAYIFCVPSVTANNGDSEGLPVVFTEAQAMGVPVVSSIHAGIPEVVRNHETGLLAPERDFGTLADHLMRFLTDETFWRACSSFAPEWMQRRFDLHRQTAELENIYAEITGTRL